MALCPEKHENPQLLSRCRVCGLPLVDLQRAFSLISARLAGKATLARPKATNVLVGIGSFGVSLVQQNRPMQGPAAPGVSYLFIDTGELPQSQGDSAGTFKLQLGGSIAGSSTFCGVAEAEAASDPSLVPVLKNVGLRVSDDKQTMFVVAALGGGTGSGVTPVVLGNSLVLNPGCRSVVLALLPSADESFHTHLNAYYGLSRLLGAGNGPLADAVVVVQYDRLKRVRGVGKGGEELKLETLQAALYGLLSSTLSFPNSAKLARLNHAAQTQVLVPCLALGRSMEIFGTLGNVLESALAFPLADASKDNVLSCYLLLRVPRVLAKSFPESGVADELAGLIKRHLPLARSSLPITAYTDDLSDRVDACLLLGGEAWRAMHSSQESHEQFKAQLRKVKEWGVYGLTEEKVRAAEKTLADYDARLEGMRRG